MPSNIKVLLVDDNPMILEMLRQGLAHFCNVQVVSDSADALLKTIDEKPDLVIADYSMPGMDGMQFLQKIKARPNTAAIPVMLMASKADINEKLKPVQDTVEDFVEKPFFTKEAAAKIKKVVDKISLEKMAREAPGDSVLRGSLAQMNVLDLLQSLDMGRKTCALTLTNNGDSCKMFFTDGQINHAVYDK
ncbi:MAG TPA: response regulator, partial [Candidatus Limnocylindrales bacterium]|nr:response regulator [Candidatus Limnocylindrales bacterium]